MISRSRRSPPCCQHRCRARRFSSRSKNKDFAEMCSGSKESSYLSSCYSYHSTLGSTKKRKKRITLGDDCAPLAREAALEGFGRAGEEGGALSLSCDAMRSNRLLQNQPWFVLALAEIRQRVNQIKAITTKDFLPV